MENAFTSENASFKVWSTLLLLGYIAWLVFLTIRSWSQQKGDRTDFFLAGKSVRLIPSLFTFWATYFSAGAVIGAAGYFYIHGIGNLIFSCCAYIIIGILTGTAGKRLWKEARQYPDLRSPIQLFLRNYRSPFLECNYSGSGSSTFSVVLAQYPLLRRRNLSTYFEHYYRNV